MKEQLLKGYKAADKSFKVHLDGFNQLDLILGNAPSARDEFIFFNDEGDLCAVRMGNIKYHFEIQENKSFNVWSRPFTKFRVPQMMDLRADPFERAWDEGFGYTDWMFRHAFLIVPVQGVVKKFVDTLKDFPPRGKSASFSIDQILEAAAANKGPGK